MKKGIHPQYYKKAKIKCACGNEFEIGATRETIEVEVCSKCHPFYTGNEDSKMRGGQVEKFRERMAKKMEVKPGNKTKGEARTKKDKD